MDKKYQVFISSTMEDLKEERQCAINTIVFNNNIPAGTELFRGSEVEWSVIKGWMDESDIYLLILGGRYGTIDPSTQKSHIEQEYEYAVGRKMPIIIISISDEMTNKKKSIDSSIDYYESDYKTEYFAFRKKIDRRRQQTVNSIEELKTKLLVELQDCIIHKGKKLQGWIRAYNTTEAIWLKTSSQNEIDKSFSRLVELILKRNYKNVEALGYHKAISSHLLKAIRGKDLLEYDTRYIQIEPAGRGKIKVTQSIRYKYAQMKRKTEGIDFHSSEVQASTYKLESFKINAKDYAKELSINIEKEDRPQYPYRVYSTNSIPVSAPALIEIKHSYECPISGYFHSHHLACPCGSLSVTINLDDKLKKDYAIVSSVASPYTSNTGDSVKANDISEMGAYYIKLPKWSPRGSGYAVALIKK